MTTYELQTGCKINLYLHVGSSRPDGYHELETLFVPLTAPSDTMGITELPGHYNAISVECSHPDINPANNTLTKAYELFIKVFGKAPAIQLSLQKKVPTGAGLGGGSANAAGLLRYLQKKSSFSHTGMICSDETLLDIATRTGADVPFFLLNVPARASGIGEALTPCFVPLHGKTLVLVCPPQKISTAWAFKALDEKRRKKSIQDKKDLTSTAHQAISSFAQGTFWKNDFEEIVFENYPELARIKQTFLDLGAEIALLSGTGASIFAIFSDGLKAEKAIEKQGNSGKVYLQHL